MESKVDKKAIREYIRKAKSYRGSLTSDDLNRLLKVYTSEGEHHGKGYRKEKRKTET